MALVKGEVTLTGLDTVDDHWSLLSQVLDQVEGAGWCGRREAMEEWRTLLEVELDRYVGLGDTVYWRSDEQSTNDWTAYQSGTVTWLGGHTAVVASPQGDMQLDRRELMTRAEWMEFMRQQMESA